MTNFKDKEQKEIIKAIAADLNSRDKNWKWKVSVVKATEIHMWWEYLKGDKQEYFKITYDPEMDSFTAYSNYGEDITDELEDNTSLKRTIYSIFWYASSRY